MAESTWSGFVMVAVEPMLNDKKYAESAPTNLLGLGREGPGGDIKTSLCICTDRRVMETGKRGYGRGDGFSRYRAPVSHIAGAILKVLN